MSAQLQSNRYETNSHDTNSRSLFTEQESRSLTHVWARVRYWGWQGISKGVMGIVYCSIVSDGARRLCPSLGQKIYHLSPILGRVNHQLDCAHFFALFLLLGCWCCWTWLLQMWLGVKSYSFEHKLVILPLALIFIAVDTLVFYFAIAQSKWGGSLLSWSAMLMTIGYVAVLVFVTYVGIVLKEEIRKEKP